LSTSDYLHVYEKNCVACVKKSKLSFEKARLTSRRLENSCYKQRTFISEVATCFIFFKKFCEISHNFVIPELRLYYTKILAQNRYQSKDWSCKTVSEAVIANCKMYKMSYRLRQ